MHLKTKEKIKEKVMRGKVIILNGPTKCGKDTLAKLICEATGSKHMEFKGLMFDVALAITGLDKDEFFTIYDNRELKEKPHPKFKGMSPRGMMIWISDNVLMPQFGPDCMGLHAATHLDLENGSVFSDGHIGPEIISVCSAVGVKNVLIARVSRQDCVFGTGGDKRKYVQQNELPGGVQFVDIANDGTLSAFVSSLLIYMNIIWNI